jgi:hypothetical protein
MHFTICPGRINCFSSVVNIYPVDASSVGYISNVHTLYAEGWRSFGCVLRNLLGRFSKYRLFATSLGWFSSLIMFLFHRYFISSSTDLIIRPLRIFSFPMYQRTLTIILRMTNCSASIFAIWLLIAVPLKQFCRPKLA